MKKSEWHTWTILCRNWKTITMLAFFLVTETTGVRGKGLINKILYLYIYIIYVNIIKILKDTVEVVVFDVSKWNISMLYNGSYAAFLLFLHNKWHKLIDDIWINISTIIPWNQHLNTLEIYLINYKWIKCKYFRCYLSLEVQDVNHRRRHG